MGPTWVRSAQSLATCLFPYCLFASAQLLALLPSEGARSANQKPKHTHTHTHTRCKRLCLSTPDGPHIGPMSLTIRKLFHVPVDKDVITWGLGYIRPDVYATFQLIRVTTWLTKHSNVNYEKKIRTRINKANRRDLIAATSLVILLKLDSNRRFFSARVTLKFDGWPRKITGHLIYIT